MAKKKRKSAEEEYGQAIADRFTSIIIEPQPSKVQKKPKKNTKKK